MFCYLLNDFNQFYVFSEPEIEVEEEEEYEEEEYEEVGDEEGDETAQHNNGDRGTYNGTVDSEATEEYNGDAEQAECSEQEYDESQDTHGEDRKDAAGTEEDTVPGTAERNAQEDGGHDYEAEVQAAIKAAEDGEYEPLSDIVRRGDGKYLIGKVSTDEDVQNYLEKIPFILVC